MMRKRLVCTICPQTDLDIAECKWINPLSQEEGHPPPANRRGRGLALANAAYNSWMENDWVLHCPRGHLLPPDAHKRDMLILGLFGESAAGKTAFVKSLVRQLGGTLEDLGISGQLAPGFKQTFKDEYLNRNEPTHPILYGDPPRKPVIMELTIGGEMLNLLIFDSSGEEGKTEGQANRQYKFAPVADALLFFAPPSTLGELPADVSDWGSHATQTLEGTRDQFHMALVAAKSNDRENSLRLKGVLPIFVLSKADQLAQLNGFPESLLDPRRYRGRTVRDILDDVNRETPLLLDFVRTAGGDSLLRKVLSFNGKGRCIAVSGTGTDDGSTRSDSSARVGAPDRCLDALLIALWEHGFLGTVA